MTVEHEVDVAILSDFRLPGGTTASIAEEVRAQSAAGISTALVHIAGSVTNYALGWSQHIRRVVGLPHVQLATAQSRLHAKVLIIRHPTVIFSTRHGLENLSADQVVVIANHAAIDAAGVQHYDIAATDAKVRDLFGRDPIWAPIGPVVRGTMLQQTQNVPFRDKDWVNVFPVLEEAQPRTGFLNSTPVIGRHSRPQPGKWPASGRDILAAYPDSAAYRVRVLGGADVAEKLLGYVPANWEVIPFGGEDPAVFLKEIDFWVYMHHPDLKEAFGRAAMEALAAGCVAVMPPYMEELFGDAALYAKPDEVRELVDEYAADVQKFLAQSRRAQQFAREFSPQMHLQRLYDLGVEHRSAAQPDQNLDTSVLTGAQSPDLAPVAGPQVLVADGAPDTELWAQWAAAASSCPQLLVVTVGQRPAAQLPAHQGLFIPSAERLNMTPEAWDQYFASRLQQVLDAVSPERVAYLGVLPPQVLTDVLDEFPARKLWLRRAATAGDAALNDALGEAQIQAESQFHLVAEAEDERVRSSFVTVQEVAR